jgi:hypothetical protein
MPSPRPSILATRAPQTGPTTSQSRSARRFPDLAPEIFAALCGVSLFGGLFGWAAITLLVYRTEYAAMLAVGSGIALLIFAGLALLVGTS